MKRLIKKAEFSNGEWYAYHSSPIKNVDSIKQNGLLVNEYLESQNLSLGGTFEGAEEWGYLRSEGDFVVVKVRLTSENIEDIKHSTEEWGNFFKEKALQIFKKLQYDTYDLENGNETFDEYIESLKEISLEEYQEEIEFPILKEFFESHELNMQNGIPASQIIEIKEVK